MKHLLILFRKEIISAVIAVSNADLMAGFANVGVVDMNPNPLLWMEIK